MKYRIIQLGTEDYSIEREEYIPMKMYGGGLVKKPAKYLWNRDDRIFKTEEAAEKEINRLKRLELPIKIVKEFL